MRHWVSYGTGSFYTNYELPENDEYGRTQRDNIDKNYNIIELGTSISIERTRYIAISPQITAGQMTIVGGGGCLDSRLNCDESNKDEIIRTFSIGGTVAIESKLFSAVAGTLLLTLIAVSGGIN